MNKIEQLTVQYGEYQAAMETARRLEPTTMRVEKCDDTDNCVVAVFYPGEGTFSIGVYGAGASNKVYAHINVTQVELLLDALKEFFEPAEIQE